MTKSELKKLNDRELVTLIKSIENKEKSYTYNLACEVLIERYEQQIHKNWWKLRAQMNNSQIVDSLEEEYYSEAKEAFWTAIQKINLDKVRDDNWKCVGWVDFYLRNVRTKLIKDTLQKGKMKSLTSMKEDEGVDESQMVDPDVESAYWEESGYKTEPSYAYEITEANDICANAIAYCKNAWDGYKNQIFDYLREGKTRAEIAKIMKENPMKIYQVATNMKNDMKKALGIN